MPASSRLAFLPVSCLLIGSVLADDPQLPDDATFSGTEDTPVPVSFGDLVSETGVSDAEDDASDLEFELVTLASGSFISGGVNPGDRLASGGVWLWTPPADEDGDGFTGFTIRAVDTGGNTSVEREVKFDLTPVDDAPTLSFVSNFSGPGIEEDADIAISHADLAAKADEADVDSDDIAFRLKNLIAGTLVDGNGDDVAVDDALANGGTWVWTPPAHDNGDDYAGFAIRAFADGKESGSDVTVEFDLTPVPDPPIIGGTITGTAAAGDFLTDDGTDSSNPVYGIFDNLTVEEVDGEDVAAEVRVSLDAETYGTLSVPGVAGSEAGGVVTYSFSERSPADLRDALRDVSYEIGANLVPVGDYEVAVDVEVIDESDDSTTRSGPLRVRSINDPAAIEASVSPGTVSDGVDVTPFRLSLSDPDLDETFRVDVVETTSLGVLEDEGFPITGDAAGVATAMRDLVYRAGALSGTATASFTVSVTEIHPDGGEEAVREETVDLEIEFTDDPPEIVGITTTILRTTDDPADEDVLPFASVTVSDPDPGQQLDAMLSLDDPAKGSFVDAAGDPLPTIEVDGESVALIEGTAAEITEALRGVVFRPEQDRVATGASETVAITLTVSSDDGSVTRRNSETRVEVTGVDGFPEVTWTGNADAGDLTFPTGDEPVPLDPSAPPYRPFEQVEIADNSTITVEVGIDDPAKGALVAPDGNGFSETAEGSGLYSFSGDPAEAETALQELEFAIDADFIFPPGQPGRTDFTITVTDAALNRTVRTLPVILESDVRGLMVTELVDDASVPGTLRHAVNAASDNDVIVFALEEYPATIRLTEGPLILDKHLTFRGPGADKLTLSGDSNGNLTADAADTALFRVFTRVEISGLRLDRGYAPSTGGAVSVGRRPEQRPGELILRDCIVSNCVAGQWGGGVDVEEGSLRVERCLFENNTLSETAGQGGGAVSLYTTASCVFVNTTFSGNAQSSPNGFGGGGIYAENLDPTGGFDVALTHCTFTGNADASDRGSAIHANVSGTRVRLKNSVFADFSGRNLMVAGAGEILSDGGNLSDDNTNTTLLQGGEPQQLTLLNRPSDQVDVEPGLAPLGPVGGRTRGHALLADSPAVGAALPEAAAVDQRGVVRNTSADSGALDFDALGKPILHEIRTGSPDFIEFFNPRDQAALALDGMELWIDGARVHTFGPADVIPAGGGLVVAESSVSPVGGVAEVIVPLDLGDRGRIELRRPSGVPVTEPQPPEEVTRVAAVAYVGVFTAPGNEPLVTQDYSPDSITLAPQFGGSAFVPHSLVQPPPNGGIDPGASGASASPGADTGGTPFGLDNAFPIAVLDRFEIGEDEPATLDLLANDLDADGADQLRLVDLNRSPVTPVPTTRKSAITTLNGADVRITPADSPLKGRFVTFDPREAFRYLPEGERFTDTFAYSVLDYPGGAIGGYADAGGGATEITAPAHRLETGDTVTIEGAGPAAYNGTFSITRVGDDTFRIPAAFTGEPAAGERGAWSAADPRAPTERAQGVVEVSVLGRNDPPTPVADLAFTSEDEVLRIFGDPLGGAPAPSLDTDSSYPAPIAVSATDLLSNDSDPDLSDQPFTKLRLAGVTQAERIDGYAGTPGESPVTVTAPGHGLADGDTILISRYGGHPSYNGYHEITVTGPDEFTVPVEYVDNSAESGFWAILEEDNRLTTTSDLGAEVTLEIRADRSLTNVVYDPTSSAELDALAVGERATDGFYYAVEDPQGAVTVTRVLISVSGVNDAPVPGEDPGGLAALDSFVGDGETPAGALGAAEVLYTLPDAGGRREATLRPAGGEDLVILSGLESVDEDSVLAIASADLLGNDADIDASDVLELRIGAGQGTSHDGAEIRLSGDGATVFYDPTAAPGLQALSAGETRVDSFELTVHDGTTGVSSRVAVAVEGRNDTPTATDATFVTAADTLLEVTPPGLLTNGTEIDQNVRLPDDRRFLAPLAGHPSTVFGEMIDITLETRSGAIGGFSAVAGNPGVTRVAATATGPEGGQVPHDLRTGEEVVLTDAGELTGQYAVTRLEAGSFAIPVPYESAFASISGAGWRALRSHFSYDPRRSVFSDDGGGPGFTLQGLAEGQTHTDRFTYTLLDGSFLFANDDMFRVEADRSSIELRVLENDANLEGLATTRTIIAVSPPNAGGEVAIEGGESLIYTPETGFVGDEVFTYTIRDDLGNRATALVTARVTIDRLNGNLRAGDDRFTVADGQSPLLDVLANDDIIPATGAPLELVSVSPSSGFAGTLAMEGGAVRYTPDPGAASFPYTETFTYTISGGGPARATATAELLVVDRSGTLNVRSDAFGIPTGTIDAPLDVLANDNILPGSTEDLTIMSVTGAAHGDVAVNAEGTGLTYTPDAGFLGTDTFSYTASDGVGGTGDAPVTVRVGYLTTNNDIFAIPFDDPDSADDDGATELDVLANDGVIEGIGGDLLISGADASPLGDVSIRPDGGALLFDPVPGATGQDTFSYTVEDAGGREATGSVTVVLIEEGIRTGSDFYTVQTDATEIVLPVLANDLRISALPGELSINALGTGPDAPDQGGTIEVAADFKSLVYTPAGGFEGVESFTYTATDGETTDTARVSVRVTQGETVAADDAFLVFRGSEANRLDVLANDRVIPDGGQSLTITATTLDPGNSANPAERGSIEIIEDGGALAYTPNPDATGFPYVETFTYEVSSGGTLRAGGTVRLEVLDRVGERDLETNHDAFTVRADSAGTLLPVLANDSVLPAGADGWTLTEVTPPTTNVCSPFLTGDFPDPAALAGELENQGDPVTSFLWSGFAPASRGVLSNNNAPAGDIAAALVSELNGVVTSGSSIHDPTRFADVDLGERTQDLLDRGVSGEQLRLLNRLLLEDAFGESLIRPAAGGGAAQISGSGVLYTPQPGFVGTDRFTYRVSDGLGGTGSAEVTVRVGDVSVSEDRYTVVAGGGAADFDVTANDGILRTAFPDEPDPARADFTLSPTRVVDVDPAAAGAAEVANGLVRFDPAAGFAGGATLTYWVIDDSGCEFPGTARVEVVAPGDDRDQATAFIEVAGVNDPPKILGLSPADVNDKNAVRPFSGATVIEYDDQRNQTVSITITYPAASGRVSGDFIEAAPGVLTFSGTAAEITAALRDLVFTPFTDRVTVGTTEDADFGVELDDGFVADPVDGGEVTTTVTPVNDPPVVSGTVSGQRVYEHDRLRPFAGVDVSDVDDLGAQPLTVTVALNDETYGNLTERAGFAPTGTPGEYRLTASPAAVSAALRGMVFTPTADGRATPGNPLTAAFELTVDDGFAPAFTDERTTVVILHGEVDKLLPLAGGDDISQEAAGFGRSVALSGSTLAIGSPSRDSADGSDSGGVFVYERNAGSGLPWGQVARLSGDDPAAGDRFGDALAMDGDLLAVGAPSDDTAGGANAGSVILFARTPGDPGSWAPVVTLTSPMAAANEAFGSALALEGDTLLIGAPDSDRPNVPRSGRVYDFQRQADGSWTHAGTLVAEENLGTSFANDGEFFGDSVALDGDTAIIGSPGANRSTGFYLNEWNFGAAYIFTRNAPGGVWTEAKKLEEFDHAGDDGAFRRFGKSVDISGDRVVVGIHSLGSGFIDTPRDGEIRIYERDAGGTGAWGEVARPAPSSGAASVHYGYAVALEDDLLMVGSPGGDRGGDVVSGYVEVRRRGLDGTWALLDRFRPGEDDALDAFGAAVALDVFTGVVGAVEDGVNPAEATRAGSARVYQFRYDLGPRQVLPVPDQVATTDQAFSFTVDPVTFNDPVYPGAPALGVETAAGAPLPAAGWLEFDPATGRFSGTPTEGERRSYELRLTATNPQGSVMISNSFRVDVATDPAGSLEAAYGGWIASRYAASVRDNPALESTVWGMDADEDGDGLGNVIEMLVGTEPDEIDPSPWVFERLSGFQSRLSFPISSAFPSDSVHVEWSTGLGGWSRAGVTLAPVDDGARMEAVIVSPDRRPVLFVRVVTEP